MNKDGMDSCFIDVNLLSLRDLFALRCSNALRSPVFYWRTRSTATARCVHLEGRLAVQALFCKHFVLGLGGCAGMKR